MCEPGHSDGTATLATGGGMATAVIVAICFLILDTSAAVATAIAGLVAIGLLLAAAAAVAALAGAVATVVRLARQALPAPPSRAALPAPPTVLQISEPAWLVPAPAGVPGTQAQALPAAPTVIRAEGEIWDCAGPGAALIQGLLAIYAQARTPSPPTHMIIRTSAPAPGRAATPARGWGLSDAGSPRSGRCQEP